MPGPLGSTGIAYGGMAADREGSGGQNRAGRRRADRSGVGDRFWARRPRGEAVRRRSGGARAGAARDRGPADVLAALGLVADPRRRPADPLAATLGEVLGSAHYVQESTLERVEVKRELFASLTAWPRPMRSSRLHLGHPASASQRILPGASAAWSRIRWTRRSSRRWSSSARPLDRSGRGRTYPRADARGRPGAIRLRDGSRASSPNRMQGALIGAARRMVVDGVARSRTSTSRSAMASACAGRSWGRSRRSTSTRRGRRRLSGAKVRSIRRSSAARDAARLGRRGAIGKVEEQRRATLSAPRLSERSVWRDRG